MGEQIMKYWLIAVSVLTALFLQQPFVYSAPGDIVADGFIESKDGGFVFPDGSIQEKAVTAPVAYPQKCSTDVSASEEIYLSCFSYGPDDPHWSSINGVPDGYYFLVTDVTIMPITQNDTGEYTFYLYLIGGCNNGVEGGSSLTELIPLKIVPNSQTWSAHYESPLLILYPGSCLRVTGWSSNTADVYFRVTGYLTNDPNNFRY